MAKIQRMSLQYEIISYIKNYIQEHNLKAGERLPSQAEMLEMMGVSRTALREAIKTLEAKDVLEVKNGKGVYVKENFKEALYNQVDIVKEQESLVQMLEVRLILEKEMLKLVVQNSTQEELDELGGIVKVLMEKYHRGERQNKEDEEFHRKLYRMCHWDVLEQLLAFLANQMNSMWNFPLDMESPFTETIPLHEELYQALCQRDVRKAIEIDKNILRREIKEIKEL